MPAGSPAGREPRRVPARRRRHRLGRPIAARRAAQRRHAGESPYLHGHAEPSAARRRRSLVDAASPTTRRSPASTPISSPLLQRAMSGRMPVAVVDGRHLGVGGRSVPGVDGAQRRAGRRGLGLQPARRRRDRRRRARCRCTCSRRRSTVPDRVDDGRPGRSRAHRRLHLLVLLRLRQRASNARTRSPSSHAFRRAFAPGAGPRLVIKSVNGGRRRSRGRGLSAGGRGSRRHRRPRRLRDGRTSAGADGGVLTATSRCTGPRDTGSRSRRRWRRRRPVIGTGVFGQPRVHDRRHRGAGSLRDGAHPVRLRSVSPDGVLGRARHRRGRARRCGAWRPTRRPRPGSARAPARTWRTGTRPGRGLISSAPACRS